MATSSPGSQQQSEVGMSRSQRGLKTDRFLIGQPGFFVAFGQPKRIAEDQPKHRVVGLETNRFLTRGHGFTRPAEVQKHLSQVTVSGKVVGGKMDGPAIVNQSILELALLS
jgi:hypothetical protein